MPLDMHKSYQFGTRLGVQFNMQFGVAFDTHKVLNNLILSLTWVGFYSSITIQSKKQALVLIGKEEMVWTVERSLEG